jgi:hypothetical protein
VESSTSEQGIASPSAKEPGSSTIERSKATNRIVKRYWEESLCQPEKKGQVEPRLGDFGFAIRTQLEKRGVNRQTPA